MHVFLAGSTGVLGRRIIPLLTGHGHEVTALTRRSDQASMLRSLGARPAVADAFEPESLAAAVKLAAPDVVMHQLTDLTSGTSASNAVLRVRGTRNLMDAAHGAGVGRVISQSRLRSQPMTASYGIRQPGAEATIVLHKYLDALTADDLDAIADSFDRASIVSSARSRCAPSSPTPTSASRWPTRRSRSRRCRHRRGLPRTPGISEQPAPGAGPAGGHRADAGDGTADHLRRSAATHWW